MSTPASKRLSIARPDGRFMLSHPAHLVAQGFGSGLSPLLPGTMGTLFGWFSFAMLTARWPQFFTPLNWALIIAAAFAVGLWACGKTGRDLGAADHGSMVWDEIVAFWLVLLFIMPDTLSTQGWAFLWFRGFDMIKPPPIRACERRFKGGLGVMGDDIIAAFYTLLVFALWRSV